MGASSGRLDRQRKPGRYHKRKNSRKYRRGYATLPHAVWGDSFAPPVITPTGVTAGAPGAFTPAGATPPANLAALQALGALGQTAAWTTGQYVVLGDASNANWNGTAWVAGIHAVELDDPHVVNPASFTIVDIETWLDQHPILEVAVALREHEAAGSARVTLLDWLDGFIESLDGVDP